MRKLVWITVGFTYLLMVWGNMVSSTGSGLACPDWPLCHGTVAPPIRFDIILEWGHRLLAATATLLIIMTVVGVLRASQTQPTLKKSSRNLLYLLAGQIVLGGATVLVGLSITLSTIHLLVAHFVLAGLLTIACVVTWNREMITQPKNKSVEKVKRLAVAGLGAMIVQLALGAMVRHGRAGLACSQFPDCLESFLPIPFTFETAIAFTHRWWGFLLLGLFIHIFMASRKATPKLARPAILLLVLAFVQVILGIYTVSSGLSVHFRGVHAAVGYGLWGILFYIAIRAGGVRWIWMNRPSTQTG